ncbi:hypothetical protein V497_02284 [Pseudogymnoascus sp. VKM F-4516 (FW-969)]|nr:hypothetical protein V497_02284 [Pseudogymnoascus sp. VKM F-4516 (FW-969)]
MNASASDSQAHFQDAHYIEEPRSNCVSRNWKSENNEEYVQDTKGEDLEHVSKKAKIEDEKVEIYNTIVVFKLRFKLWLKLRVRLAIVADDAVRRAIDDVGVVLKEQQSAGHHPMIPVVDNTSIFCCKVPPRERAKWRTECREKLANHIHSQLGLTILPTNVKLITNPEDLYQWSILTAEKTALFNKQLSKHSTGAYIDLCNGVGVHFKAALGKGAADYEPETRLVTTITAFNAPEKSREHSSSNTIAEEWREKLNAEVAIREALEIEMMGIKGENAELLTEMKALREEEAARIQELEEIQEVLLITSRILQERALKASEDSQKITHAATSLKMGSNPSQVVGPE